MPYGQSLTFTATVVAVHVQCGCASGNVIFCDGSTSNAPLQVVALSTSDGVTTASFSASGLSAGVHTIWAVYADPEDFQSSQAAAANVSIGKATPGLTLATPPSTITYDGTTDVTSWAVAALTGVSGGLSPTGSPSVVYYNGTSASGSAITSSPVNAGTYTVVADYAGDANYAAAQSAPVTFIINRAATTVALASPPTSIVYDGTSDVTNWVSAAVTGVNGARRPRGARPSRTMRAIRPLGRR